jgi:hypothetical protein
MPKILVVLPLARFAPLACFALMGCQPIALSMAGAGATAAVGYSMSGISYRTFTAPLPVVKRASIAALENMGITLESSGKFDEGETLYARAAARTVEIELEALSQRATRMRVSTRDGGFFYDGATASEIVAQTQKVLEAPPVTDLTRDAKRVSAN